MKRYIHSNPTKFSDYMQIINQLKNDGIDEIPKQDVIFLFGRATDQLANELEYLGCNVTNVADLFNVKLPDIKFTRAEIQKQRESERLFDKLM